MRPFVANTQCRAGKTENRLLAIVNEQIAGSIRPIRGPNKCGRQNKVNGLEMQQLSTCAVRLKMCSDFETQRIRTGGLQGLRQTSAPACLPETNKKWRILNLNILEKLQQKKPQTVFLFRKKLHLK